MASPGELLHLKRLSGVVDGVVKLHLLRGGIHLGLFEALRQRQTGSDLAERLGLAGDLIDAWLRAARSQGLLERKEEAYRISSFVRWLLDSPDAPALSALLDQTALSYAPRLQELPDLMKGAERPAFGTAEEALRVAAVARLTENRALGALARIPGVTDARSVLDVGCGYGHYLAGLLGRYRDARGLGVELDPDVAEEARRALREADVERRGEIRVGDFMTLDLPKGTFDLILLNNNLYYFAPSDRSALFSRIVGRLTEKGILAIQIPTHPRGRLAERLGADRFPATFDLVLRSHRNLYGLPDLDELREQLIEAGFKRTGRVPVMPGGGSVYQWARLG